MRLIQASPDPNWIGFGIDLFFSVIPLRHTQDMENSSNARRHDQPKMVQLSLVPAQEEQLALDIGQTRRRVPKWVLSSVKSASET